MYCWDKVPWPLLPTNYTGYFRGIARIFPWGGPKYHFQNFGKCNPTEEISGEAVGTFPNYLNGYEPSNRVVILERFRLP